MTSYSPEPVSPANDRTTVYGVVGIIGAICCLPVGIILGILAVREAKRTGKPPTLGYIALIVSAISLVWTIIAFASGIGPYGGLRN